MKTKTFLLMLAIFANISVNCATKIKIGELCYVLDKINRTATVVYEEGWCIGSGFSPCDKTPAYSNLSIANIPSNIVYNDTTYIVNKIGDFAFSACPNLSSVTIPNSIIRIGEYAFQCCYNLTSIVIPQSVTDIEYCAFGGCRFNFVMMESTIPPILHPYYSEYWHEQTFPSCPIFVPCGSLIAYQNAPYWNQDHLSQIKYAPYPSYSITTIAENGNISYSAIDTFTVCSEQHPITLSAKPNHGYYFVQWADGDTANPRTIELTQDTVMTAYFAMNYSGQCGDNLYWKYSNSILTITGNGDMYDTEIAPWKLFRDSITSIVLPNGLTSIGYGGAFEECKNLVKVDIPSSVTKINSYAFYDCEKLNSVTLPISLTTLGYSAFEGCRKLYNIYCYAAEPPVAEASSFENYNVYLRVPCDNLQDYQMDAVFGSFKYIECIGAEEIPVTSVTVVPNSNSVEITWPKNDQAANYTIEIKKDDVTFCTLTFNAQGQLTSIAFAPGRGANKNVNAIEVANGYKFTITSLNSGTKYNYEIDTQNASGTSIANYTGTFTTTDPTALKQLSDSPIERFTKVINDGQLFILRDGIIYNAQGAVVE